MLAAARVWAAVSAVTIVIVIIIMITIVKVDALIDGVRPADALYVWRETSLYSKWFPMVTSSTELLCVNEADSLLHLEMVYS
jgi:hypothetical protein